MILGDNQLFALHYGSVAISIPRSRKSRYIGAGQMILKERELDDWT
jgi:hypothetical protein